MKAIQKYFDQQFNTERYRKDNLIQCMKWLTKFVIGKEKEGTVTYEITKNMEDPKDQSINLKLYAILDDVELHARRCKACKEFYRSFFITEANDCDRCRSKAYRKDVKSTLTTITSYKNEKLRDKIERGNQ